MRDKTLILLDKITKTFNLIIDFLMSKSIIIGKKVFWEAMLVLPYIGKKIFKAISFIAHKIEKSKDWKFFESNLIRAEKKLLRKIPKPVIEVTAYILDSLIYIIQTLISITVKILRVLIVEAYNQIKKLPHAHKRVLFTIFIVFVVSILVFREQEPKMDAEFEFPCPEEEIVDKKDIPDEIIVEEPIETVEKKQIVISYGDTLVDILQTNSVEYNDIDSVIRAMKKCYNPKKLTPGKKIDIVFKEGIFIGLELNISLEEKCIIAKTDENKFNAEIQTKELTTEIIEKQAVIKSSLFKAGEQQNIPNSILVEFIKMYSWDVDFVRDIRSNDKFSIVYERFTDDEGNFVKNGEIIYANMNLSGANIPIYKYKGDYFKEDGSNIRKALLRTPINGARVSSSFGMRKHPVQGFTKLHGGIDFAAPRGTPIYAAGDGKITRRSYDKYNGNLVKIKHNSTYVTAYAHMNKFASNQKVGSRVN